MLYTILFWSWRTFYFVDQIYVYLRNIIRSYPLALKFSTSTFSLCYHFITLWMDNRCHGLVNSQMLSQILKKFDSSYEQRSYWINCSYSSCYRHLFESLTVATMIWLTVTEYLCHKWPRDYGYVSCVVITIWSFPQELHDGCHLWNRICLIFRNTWVHPRFLVRFVLFNH
jgi:hypothetical protein